MERKLNNFESKILREETIKEYGYDPDILGRTSTKFVIAICRVCGENHRVRKGFFLNQNSACHKECKIIEMKHFGSPFNDVFIRDKAKSTIKEKYGVDNISQNLEVARKISETKNTEEYKKNIEQKMMDKYGVKNILKDKKVRQKIKDTNLERYGTIYPSQNEEIKKKISEVKLENSKNKNINIYKIIDDAKLNKAIVLKEIKEELEKLNFKVYLTEELDIYIPEKKFAIEFNGSYWHSEAILEPSGARNKHIKKLKLCRERGIRLFNIFENQWGNRKVQFLNFIKSILGASTTKVGARECILNNENCKGFIEKHHIQGYGHGSIKFFNLVHNGEVIASMTASKHHRQNVEGNPIVLNRLVFKDGVTVQGGASKLFKEFKNWAKGEGYDRVLSWSDNCYGEGNIYKVLDFELIKEYSPDYFYWDMENDKYLSKQSQKKSNIGCPEEITERDFLYNKNIFRIWTCGQKLWRIMI